MLNCEHGKAKNGYYCVECPGKGICKHNRRKNSCRICGTGSYLCTHGKVKNHCNECGADYLCEHGKQQSRCVECDGAGICEHQHKRASCKQCKQNGTGGTDLCQHLREKHRCRDCGGVGICEHGVRNDLCKDCGGSALCVHKITLRTCRVCPGGGTSYCDLHGGQKTGPLKWKCEKCGTLKRCPHGKYSAFDCKECKPDYFCEHGRQKESCAPCGGNLICEHYLIRYYCRECKGGAYCSHGKIRYDCRDCGGGRFCEHGNKRNLCKEQNCNGSFLCVHKIRRDRCRDCGGSAYCEHKKFKDQCKECQKLLCEHCHLFVVYELNDEGKRFCRFCDIHLFRLSKRGEKERKVAEYLAEHFPHTYATGNQVPFKSCDDRKKPDIILRIGKLMAIVENDENRHQGYKIDCEWSKLLQHCHSALQTEDVEQVLFIRFNPDGRGVTDTILQQRLQNLVQLIEDRALHSDELLEVYHMYYNEENDIEKATNEELELWIDYLRY